ncbi:MAG: penicillin-binding transpeptidase domain-containing protein [Clostridia bacterium]|nr:penicillin-binding transpeptidase domain-containing protein [Clostridia bacterium]MDD4386901.1 penicillin-binding transpeptidase domain-containing protein [Clostridia bacterium]
MAVKNKKRIVIILMFCLVVTILLFGRLIYIQVIKSEHYKEKAYEQQTRERVVTSKRGTIYDATGEKIFAQSISTSKITIIPNSVNKKEEVGLKLSEILEISVDDVMAKLNKNSAQETIYSKLDNEKSQKILEYISKNDIEGIKIDEDTKRIYPYSYLLAHTLGFVGTDNQGLAGIEAEYENELKGISGKIVGSTDGKGNETPFTNEQYVDPIDGKDLILTIDATIQSITEKYLEKALKENIGLYATAIVIRPSTGEVLAIATAPTFDLNDPFSPNTDELKQKWDTLTKEDKSKELNAMWRNKVISDTAEPGSSFKIVTVAAAIEEGVANMDDAGAYNCNGFMKIDSWIIKCWRYPRAHGAESLREGIMNSCNPVFMQVSSKLGVDTYVKYLEAFNLYSKTGIDLPGEATGIMHDKTKMTAVDLATTSFGQTIQITTLQTAVNYSAIANGGYIIKPFVVKEVRSKNGDFEKKTESQIVKQIVSKATADITLSALEDTVKFGTAKAAQVRGYRVAGKTATAEVGRGAGSTYMAGFAGIAPVNSPEIVVVVNIMDPKGPLGHQGSTLCAPVVGSIIDETLRYLDVKPEYTIEDNNIKEKVVPDLNNKTYEEATKILIENGFKIASDNNLISTDVIIDQIPKVGASLMEGSTIRVYINKDTKQTVNVPDLRNKSTEVAKKALQNIGLNVRIIGNGYVLTQDPSLNTVIEKGSIVTIKCVDTMDLP